jgi:transcription elongation GreA/GreB family factor
MRFNLVGMTTTEAGGTPFTSNTEEEAVAQTTTVRVRSIVEVEWGVRGVYRIGLEGESDPDRKIIGVDAPVAAAICGASEGDVRRYMVRGDWRSVTVLNIHSEAGGTNGC